MRHIICLEQNNFDLIIQTFSVMDIFCPPKEDGFLFLFLIQPLQGSLDLKVANKVIPAIFRFTSRSIGFMIEQLQHIRL